MTPYESPDVRCIGEPRLTAGLGVHPRLGLAAHRSVHGAPPRLPAGALVAMAESVDLRGRGGAAFPVARKLRAVARGDGRRAPVVVVNAMEGEPASAKDATLLARAPHLVLDGALLAAEALGAGEVVVGVAADGPGRESVTAAVAERGLGGYARVAVLPGRFVAGESGALVRGIAGEPPIPPPRKVLPSTSGVDGRPTLTSNAETYAQLATVAELGSGTYRAVGTAREPGTVLLTVGGRQPCVVETPTGVPLTTVLAECGAAAGRTAVLVGGYHGKWLTPQNAAAVTVARESLAEVGGVLGAGVILPLDAETCPLGEVARVASYLALESSGQCGPCRFGLPDVARKLVALADGAGGDAELDGLRRMAAGVRGRGACAHPDGTSRFVLSALDVFADDVTEHLVRGTCGRDVRGALPVPSAPADLHLQVDWSRCQGHGLCAALAPELIHLDANGYPVLTSAAIPPWLHKPAHQAVEMCPTLALRPTTGAPRRTGARAARAADPRT